ncbi:MAG TPA: hypothetical protein VLS89_21405 [Candidatus Nanopelagicales bacterium]|nr:hypothetical protein [Candidatus Nanopelagicales bacterium]
MSKSTRKDHDAQQTSEVKPEVSPKVTPEVKPEVTPVARYLHWFCRAW